MARAFLHQWEVRSHTGDDVYKVTEYLDGTWACACPRWKFCKAPKLDCKHILGVKAEEPHQAMPITQMQEQARRQMIRPPEPTSHPVFVLQTRRVIQLG
jgi:hypothetical protein